MLDLSFIDNANHIVIISNVVTGLLFVVMAWNLNIPTSPMKLNRLFTNKRTLFNSLLFIYGLLLTTNITVYYIASKELTLVLQALIVLIVLSMTIYVVRKNRRVNLNSKLPEDIEQEINDRLGIEDRLIAKNNQLEWAERTAKICYANWNIVDNTLQFSDGAEDILGIAHTHEGINFDLLLAIAIPEDRIKLQRVLENIINKKEFNPFLFRIIIDSKLKYIQVNGAIITQKKGVVQLIRGTFQDVTEQQMFVKRIEDKNETLREIAQTQSHDVRGPLATIMGLTQLLNDDELNEETKEIINGIRLSSDQLDEIIKGIVKRAESIDVDLS